MPYIIPYRRADTSKFPTRESFNETNQVAYKYVTKEDTEALHSPGHPDLTTVPNTEAVIGGKKLCFALLVLSSQMYTMTPSDVSLASPTQYTVKRETLL